VRHTLDMQEQSYADTYLVKVTAGGAQCMCFQYSRAATVALCCSIWQAEPCAPPAITSTKYVSTK
jgi:hypothetical protein